MASPKGQLDKMSLLMAAVILVLSLIVVMEWTRSRGGTIVIPAGGTYLGPTK